MSLVERDCCRPLLRLEVEVRFPVTAIGAVLPALLRVSF